MVLVAVVFGAFSEGVDRLREAHFLITFSFPAWPDLPSVVWIGMINAGGMLIGIGVAELLIRRWQVQDNRRLGPLILANSAGLILAVLGVALAPNFGIALAAAWMAQPTSSLACACHRAFDGWSSRCVGPSSGWACRRAGGLALAACCARLRWANPHSSPRPLQPRAQARRDGGNHPTRSRTARCLDSSAVG